MASKSQYVDLKSTGQIFPSWVLHNFKKYKLPEILRAIDEDPCSAEVKLELRKYQEFIGQYLGPLSPYHGILLYHGLGSGKTATVINLMNILYNYDHNYHFVICIKASLRDDPWMKDLKIWMERNPNEEDIKNVSKLSRFQSIHFVHYDSPYADRDFLDVMKKLDTSKPIAYFIDESHNFIRNVYSNINSKVGRRAQVIYDYILRDKRESKNTKVVLISATPTINIPFELSLLFNLLRPGILPASEDEFNRIFVTESTYPILNPIRRNMFQRRVLGLVSYYVGATPDLYARRRIHYVNLPMTQYHYDIYRIFEKIETDIQARARRYGKQSQLYKSYTRQASNFIFPYVNINVNGELRPRPSKYKIDEKVAETIQRGKKETVNQEEQKERIKRYLDAMEHFITETEQYFIRIHQEDVKSGRTIFDDLNDFQKQSAVSESLGDLFVHFSQSDEQKSNLFKEMYQSSPKMLAIVFISYVSPGKVMVYTNYVIMEGIDMLKIYYRLIGFNDFTIAKESMGYCEYHGRMDFKDRTRVKNIFNSNDNIYGTKCKVILLSPSATEGIQLYDIRQEHITEPYWTEVRIQQVIGRGIRQCSHKNLPMIDRVVDIFRYKINKPDVLDPDDINRQSTDEYIEDQAKAKENLNESFLSALKEAAVDCELFKAHNMMSQSYYCFKFPENNLLGDHIGPAYREDIKDDIKYDFGLNAKNSTIERIKVVKIDAVYKMGSNEYSTPDKYWYHPESGMVYDFETHYPVGEVKLIDELPEKMNKDVYIISYLIKIPTIQGVTANP